MIEQIASVSFFVIWAVSMIAVAVNDYKKIDRCIIPSFLISLLASGWIYLVMWIGKIAIGQGV